MDEKKREEPTEKKPKMNEGVGSGEEEEQDLPLGSNSNSGANSSSGVFCSGSFMDMGTKRIGEPANTNKKPKMNEDVSSDEEEGQDLSADKSVGNSSSSISGSSSHVDMDINKAGESADKKPKINQDVSRDEEEEQDLHLGSSGNSVSNSSSGVSGSSSFVDVDTKKTGEQTNTKQNRSEDDGSDKEEDQGIHFGSNGNSVGNSSNGVSGSSSYVEIAETWTPDPVTIETLQSVPNCPEDQNAQILGRSFEEVWDDNMEEDANDALSPVRIERRYTIHTFAARGHYQHDNKHFGLAQSAMLMVLSHSGNTVDHIGNIQVIENLALEEEFKRVKRQEQRDEVLLICRFLPHDLESILEEGFSDNVQMTSVWPGYADDQVLICRALVTAEMGLDINRLSMEPRLLLPACLISLVPGVRESVSDRALMVPRVPGSSQEEEGQPRQSTSSQVETARQSQSWVNTGATSINMEQCVLLGPSEIVDIFELSNGKIGTDGMGCKAINYKLRKHSKEQRQAEWKQTGTKKKSNYCQEEILLLDGSHVIDDILDLSNGKIETDGMGSKARNHFSCDKVRKHSKEQRQSQEEQCIVDSNIGQQCTIETDGVACNSSVLSYKDYSIGNAGGIISNHSMGHSQEEGSNIDQCMEALAIGKSSNQGTEVKEGKKEEESALTKLFNMLNL